MPSRLLQPGWPWCPRRWQSVAAPRPRQQQDDLLQLLGPYPTFTTASASAAVTICAASSVAVSKISARCAFAASSSAFAATRRSAASLRIAATSASASARLASRPCHSPARFCSASTMAAIRAAISSLLRSAWPLDLRQAVGGTLLSSCPDTGGLGLRIDNRRSRGLLVLACILGPVASFLERALGAAFFRGSIALGFLLQGGKLGFGLRAQFLGSLVRLGTNLLGLARGLVDQLLCLQLGITQSSVCSLLSRGRVGQHLLGLAVRRRNLGLDLGAQLARILVCQGSDALRGLISL